VCHSVIGARVGAHEEFMEISWRTRGDLRESDSETAHQRTTAAFPSPRLSQNTTATTAATTTNARPRSPAIHFVYSLSVVNGVKIDCIQRLWLACRKMGGHSSQNHEGRPTSR
jgi:hypothetical protein